MTARDEARWVKHGDNKVTLKRYRQIMRLVKAASNSWSPKVRELAAACQELAEALLKARERSGVACILCQVNDGEIRIDSKGYDDSRSWAYSCTECLRKAKKQGWEVQE